MRVIAGIRKGLKLKAPEGEDTRPTTDRVKESVFNIIQPYIPAERVLDLFAGSGALGIEALSRRSARCIFVEHDRKAFALVRQNIGLARLEDVSELVLADALSYLKSASAAFDIIFLDPPYNKGYLSPVLEEISRRELLTSDGIIVAETEKDGEEPTHPDYTAIRQAVYGKTVITVLKRGDSQ